MAKLGRPTQQLRLRKVELLLEFARSYAALGRTNAERERALASLDLIQALAKEKPDDEEVQYTLADVFVQVGDVFQLQGHLEEALAQYRVSLVIGKRLSASRDTATSNRGRNIQSAPNERIGDVLKTQGHLDEAIKYYRSEVLLQPNPSPYLYERVGDVLFAQGKMNEALQQFRQELALFEHQMSLDSENAEWRRGVSVAHHYIGTVLLAQGKIENRRLGSARSPNPPGVQEQGVG
jgi:tetratricopeptide (TPR) repeat protein